MSLTRRSLFSLPLLPFLRLRQDPAEQDPAKFEYKGFLISWTGWKPAQSNFNLVGQWIAWSKNSPTHFYASVPGKVAPFYAGMEFDISVQPDQAAMTPLSSEENLEVEKAAALRKLLARLDKE